VAYRKPDDGGLTYNSDNAVTVGGTYQIVQNRQLQLTFAKRSGSAFDVGAPKVTGGLGNQLLTFVLFESFYESLRCTRACDEFQRQLATRADQPQLPPPHSPANQVSTRHLQAPGIGSAGASSSPKGSCG